MKKNIINKRYEIIKVLGNGGMSTVYLCKDLNSNKNYAVKIMRYDSNMNSLEREWYILRCLNHKGIPKAKEFFIENNNLHLVEDFIEGTTLQHLIEKNGLLSIEKSCQIILQLCDIVSYLHNFNPPIIYRDMKPSNIMITDTGNIILLDFGISRLYKEDKSTDTVFMGSKGYAAPEQYGLSQSKKATDIYGIGAVLYFLVTGNAPQNIMEPLEDKNYNNAVSKNIINIIKTCMQIDLKDRYTDVHEIKKQVLACLNEEISENSASTKLLNTQDATRILNDEFTVNANTSVAKKRLTGKRLTLIIGVFLLTTLSILSIYNYFNKKPLKPVEPAKVLNPILEPSPTPQITKAPEPTNTPETTKPVEKKEVVIEGTIIKSKPTKIIELENDDNEKVKGKSKKKDLDKERVLIYNLSTPAEVIKNENFKISLNSLAVMEDYIVAFCYIENSTSKNLSLSYKNTYFYHEDGDKVSPITSMSSDLSSIRSNTKINNISIYFKKFQLESGKLILKTNIDFNDKNYNNVINLIINVK